ncbi:hypothetical protein J437_LFUL008288 [Ladona fulva]|uniref:Uncharacterized protein n=1 Tax=Ladona fulva TaxID=123851 RepID=A0A8K0P0L6_LADFU|nr:hypothetical protein J437_LFUL008288 [Ladona fulva]
MAVVFPILEISLAHLSKSTLRQEAIGCSVKISTAGGSKKRIKVVKPDLSCEDEELQNVVGLHVGPCSIYWAKIKRSGDVLDWSHRKLFPIAEMSKKIRLPQLYEEVSSMLEHIPVGDVYILEAANHVQPSSLQSSSASLSALLHAQILAMLMALLNCRVESDLIYDSQEDIHRELDSIHKVYFLRPRMMSRLFRLLVGSERVSALDLVDSIIDGSRELKVDFAVEGQEDTENTRNEEAELHPTHIFTPVKVPSNIAASYYKLRAVEREEMCQALLIAMTFYDLVVFKDPKVLAPLQM